MTGTNLPKGLILRAIGISVLINGIIFFSGTLANLVLPLAGLAKVAQIVAAPPALLLGHWLRPNSKTLSVIVAAGMGAFVWSVVFYAAVAWVVLLLWSRWHSRPTDTY